MACLLRPLVLLVAAALALPGGLALKAWAQESQPHAPVAALSETWAGCSPDQATFPTDSAPLAAPRAPGASSVIARMSELPIAFVPSGSPCLGPVPVYRLGLLVSGAPAASTLEMARRLAPALAQYSHQTGLEGCARMCKTPRGEIVARPVTIYSHASCAAPGQTCPQGSQPLAETIHSHPPGPVFVANAIDLVGWGLETGMGEVMWTGDPNEPSEEDRANAPLWLVGADGRLRWVASPKAPAVVVP